MSLQPGDRLLVRNTSQLVKRGILEAKVHIIVSRIADNEVLYKVKQDDEGNSKIRVLLRNMIIKVDDILDNFD